MLDALFSDAPDDAVPIGTRTDGPVALDYAASFVEDGGRSDFASSLLAAPTSLKADGIGAHAASASGDAIDTDLKIVARRMMGSLPELARAAEEVGFLNQQLAALRRTATSDAIARGIVELEQHKAAVIARVRDEVLRQALSDADQELGGVMRKAQSMRLDADGVNIGAGADYLTHAIDRLRELTAQLEIGGEALTPLETRLEALRKAFAIEQAWEALEVDLEKTLVGLEQEAVGRNLDAAGAQAQTMIDTIGFRGIDAAVAAMESHLGDAQRLLAGLDPTLRGQFKERVATVKQQVDRVYRSARRGRFDSAGIRTLPARVSAINEIVKAAPLAPGRQ